MVHACWCKETIFLTRKDEIMGLQGTSWATVRLGLTDCNTGKLTDVITVETGGCSDKHIDVHVTSS